MDVEVGPVRDGVLFARVARWRRIALASVTLLVLCVVALLVLIIRQSQGVDGPSAEPIPAPAPPGDPLERATGAVRRVSESRVVAVEAAKLRTELSGARIHLTRYFITADRRSLEPLPGALTRANEQIRRLRGLVTEPGQRALLDAADKGLRHFASEYDRLVQEAGGQKGVYEGLLRLDDVIATEVLQPVEELAGDADRRHAEQVAELEAAVK